MNNSYLNILLIYAPLRYGSEFWLWQILNRKIFFLNVIITDLLLTTNVSRWVNLQAWSNRHIFVLEKKSKINPFLRIRKIKFLSRFFELPKCFNTIPRTPKLWARNCLNKVGKDSWKIEKLGSSNYRSYKLEKFRLSWKAPSVVGKFLRSWKVLIKAGAPIEL